jgi:hypothetical protein
VFGQAFSRAIIHPQFFYPEMLGVAEGEEQYRRLGFCNIHSLLMRVEIILNSCIKEMEPIHRVLALNASYVGNDHARQKSLKFWRKASGLD